MEAHAHKGLMAVDRTPLQTYSLVVGAFLTVLGVVGFFVNADFSTGGSISANTLIFFDINGWSNLLHLATGLAGMYAATRVSLARQYAMVVGAIYVVIALVGVFSTTVLSMIVLNTADTVLYAAIGVIGLALALGPMADKK